MTKMAKMIKMLKITVPVSKEWNHMFKPSESFAYDRRAFQRREGKDDFVTAVDVTMTASGEWVFVYTITQGPS